MCLQKSLVLFNLHLLLQLLTRQSYLLPELFDLLVPVELLVKDELICITARPELLY